jgi:PhnB protein
MNKAILFNFDVDKENNKIRVERSFNAPLELVWAAWTEADLLDQWWAPKPYRVETKSMDFREGGRWAYAMVSPENEKHWCIFDYETIQPQRSYSGKDAFTDENGTISTAMPSTQWVNKFRAEDADSTIVNCELQFKKLDDLETLIQMGFKEGFTAGLENLDQYIAAQFYLRKQNKPDNRPRVSWYLNFDGKTEEAFLFYKSVFRTEFVNGIKRLGDVPASAEHPPIADAVKKMVLHVELPLIGGHVLMGTDAPKEMGFTIKQGNNMHINLEPDSREEATRLFTELSAGGVVEMPMQDMFFGAYYGNFTDKFGINWMINHQNV